MLEIGPNLKEILKALIIAIASVVALYIWVKAMF